MGYGLDSHYDAKNPAGVPYFISPGFHSPTLLIGGFLAAKTWRGRAPLYLFEKVRQLAFERRLLPPEGFKRLFLKGFALVDIRASKHQAAQPSNPVAMKCSIGSAS
jgi:hypothetical protein